MRGFFSSVLALSAALIVAACAAGAKADARDDSQPSSPEPQPAWSPERGGPNLPEAPGDPSAPTPPPGPDGKKDAGPPPPPVDAIRPSQGEVLITEVMYDPTGIEPLTEWFEVHNVATTARTLSGLTIVDGAGRKHVIGPGVTVVAGAYVVIARNRASAIAAKVPAEVIAYEYGAGLDDNSGVQLSNNSTGGISLVDGTTTITTAKYGGWFTGAAGRAIEVKSPSFAAGTSSSSWCFATTPWATGSDKGTPGRANDCP
jgi:hypothetical protein